MTKTSVLHAAAPEDMPASGPFLVDRRTLLRGAASSFVLGFAMTGASQDAFAGTGSRINNYIQIDTDGAGGNIVTLYSGATEMGQGIMTGLAQLVAEELKAPMSQIRVEHAVPVVTATGYVDPFTGSSNPYGRGANQSTGGSWSMRTWFKPLRTAAATAREMLRTAAASPAFFNTAASNVTMANGVASCNGVSIPYAALASAAASLPLPNPLPAPAESGFTVIGQRAARVDVPDKVYGKAVFGIDVNAKTAPNLAGLVYAAVKHCPTIGGTVKTTPTKPSGALAVVNLTNAVAVVATNTWTAMKLADALSVSWNIPTTATAIDSANIATTSNALLTSAAPAGLQTIQSVGAPDAALTAGTPKIDATYVLPHVAHACMEPLNCTAVVTLANSTTLASCEIWAPTQSQSSCIKTAVTVLGQLGITATPQQIIVHTTMLGGGLGRKIEQDFIAQAIAIAKAVAKPVKLTWTRVQDFQNDRYRPTAYIRVQAAYDAASQSLSGLVYRNVASSISKQNGSASNDTGGVAGVTDLAYANPAKRVEFVPNNVGVPLGYWRSVGESYNTFAMECAIDELAAAAGEADTLAFRKKLLAGNTSAIAVLDAVATLSNWYAAPPTGVARGLAFMKSFGSTVAMVAEVSVNATTGYVTVQKVYCAIDCGTAVNPDSIEAQIQGSVVHGLTATLWSQVKFTAGKTNLTNFNTYRMLKLKEMPKVLTQVLPSANPVGGVGETAVPVVAPAVANAYAKLKNIRVRNLPFYPGSTMGGL